MRPRRGRGPHGRNTATVTQYLKTLADTAAWPCVVVTPDGKWHTDAWHNGSFSVDTHDDPAVWHGVAEALLREHPDAIALGYDMHT